MSNITVYDHEAVWIVIDKENKIIILYNEPESRSIYTVSCFLFGFFFFKKIS